MTLSKFTLSALCSAAILFAVPLARSKATTSLAGHVTDSSGASVAGASIKLDSVATGTSRSGVTGKSGDYSFPQLAPGSYELKDPAKEFATADIKSSELLVSQPGTMNVTLKVATSKSKVTVTAETQPLLNTTDATLG